MQMRIKLIQADTRPMKVYMKARNLTYGPPDQMNLGFIASLNNNILLQPNDANSIGRCLNLLKAKLLGIEYEFILGNKDDWESEGKKAHCWIKIHSLIEQMKNPTNQGINLFCFIDSDAWIRDEKEFLDFCHKFSESQYSIACPRDIELPGNSFLNSGFLAVKNTPQALQILETIYSHPDYREFDKKSWHEQSELSIYHEKHPGEILVLPLNDFNTPCGRIVRHCWIKHLVEPLVIEEALATLMRLSLSFTSDPRYSIGNEIMMNPEL